jgi:opacity protein-like surface antigen
MKRLLFVLFALLPMCSFAQEVEVRRVEGSISLGASFFEDSFYESTAGEIGLLSSVELRYNFRSVPMDVGVMSMLDIRGGDCELCNGSWENNLSFLAVADYNFRRGKRVSYFAGVGVGATFYDANTTKLCFMPRVGMEFFNRLRLTMAYMAGPNAKNTLNLTLGVAIGGGRKK